MRGRSQTQATGKKVCSQDFSPRFLSTLCAYYKPIKINGTDHKERSLYDAIALSSNN
ncbi:MAG: hypothetical protein RMZ42_03810 [Nostoc sp. DedQUE05]|uniref:hypothetical protein n=1 Tax=Nostoc sp. DedQUE05 TaxID=3075391 RepID=UPI002AD48994|nr:hypothetical protein [Nostoc sp. DedQUE05]MDZ8091057.1 hypothetical protein [Nostoc sp. DedQUE05]